MHHDTARGEEPAGGPQRLGRGPTWDTPASVPCATYKVYAAADTGLPKDSFTPYVEIGSTMSGSFTHVGAATDGSDYDYLVVIEHPMYGLGPLGHYGLF